MKRIIASLCVVGGLLASPLQSFTDTKVEASTMKNGWSCEGGSWYYYSNNSKLTGWHLDGGNWYYLAWNGSMVKDWKTLGGKKYYFNASGAMVTGWQYINGDWYAFDNSGAMKTGWHYDGANWYYLAWNGTMVKGFQTLDGKRYYFNDSGAKVTGWQKINGLWYLFDKNGVMHTGWTLSGGNWYYLNANGAMSTGWAKINGSWYSLNSDGAMRTGWYYTGADWYYLNPSGAMTTGWQKINGVWYYMRGSGEWVQPNVADTLKTIGSNQQLILVTAGSYGTNSATVQTFEKTNDKWVPVTGAISGHIGRDGFAYQMSEWVTQSPRGKFTIGTAFGRYGNPGTKLPFHRINSNDVWVDDSNSQFYNTLQQSPAYGRWSSAENMNISAYNYGLVINYNTERTPGKGSAVFFHVSDSWTAGCTGVSQQNMINILRWLDPSKNPVIIQTPTRELGSY